MSKATNSCQSSQCELNPDKDCIDVVEQSETNHCETPSEKSSEQSELAHYEIPRESEILVSNNKSIF